MLVLSNSLIVLIPYRILEICNENFTDIVDMELFLFFIFWRSSVFFIFYVNFYMLLCWIRKNVLCNGPFLHGGKKNCFFMLKAPTIFGKYARYDEK